MMPATEDDELHEYLSQADPGAIRSALLGLVPQFNAGRWLRTRHPYHDKATKIVDRLSAKHVRKRPRLNEYISVSAILHCFDGWSLLGRALAAEMLGDTASATHLGYYAELRSAMSILACHGVGVFNQVHVVVNQDERSRIPKGRRFQYPTHRFVWRALDLWAEHHGSQVLARVIAPSDIPLSDWMAEFDAGKGGRNLLATSTIREWGFDLRHFGTDRTARNESSYRPRTLAPHQGPVGEDGVRFAVALWRLCEPRGLNAFAFFDRDLLRHTLGSLSEVSHRRRNDEYREQIDIMLYGLPLTNDTRDALHGFLTQDRATAPVIREQAGISATAAHDARPVLARALLLLRLSTGIVRELVESLKTDRRRILAFWWKSPSVNRRLWPTGEPPDDCADLWSDTQIALERIEGAGGWVADSRANFDLWRRHAGDMAVLSSTERICLWGLGL